MSWFGAARAAVYRRFGAACINALNRDPALLDSKGIVQFRNDTNLPRFIGTRDGRRIPGRVPQDSLFSSLGPVIDLSSGGMRVLATKPYDGKLRVTLWGGDVEVVMAAQVAWARRLGFRRHELGVSFLDLDEALRKVLTRMATDHARRRAV